jgi:predicted transposase/invertase (TIGR01784 family)
MTIPARHDSLFKFTFSKAENAASAIAAVLPQSIAQHIDFDAFELQPGSFVDVELKNRHTDLLYRTRLLDGRGDAFVHILFEHQSSPDPTMPLRMLGYMVRIWWAFLRDNPGAKLPPIVPVVLYHGTQPWTVPTSMAEMYSDAVNLEDFGALLPTANFIVDDLSAVSDEALRARALTGMAHLALGTLKHIHDADVLMPWLLSSMEALVEVWDAPDALRAIEVLTRYILTNNDVAEQAVGDTLGKVLGDKAREVAMTTAQRLYEEGEERGLQRGREEGAEAERRLAARTLITNRFVELDEESLERFDALELDALAVIYEEIFTAETLDELLERAEAAQTVDDVTSDE